MAEILERLAETQSKRTADAAARFTKLVASIAAGRDVKENEIEKTLDGAGRTLAELAAAVAVAQDRAAKRARLAEFELAAAERPELQARIADAQAVFDDAERVFNTAVGPLEDRLSEIAALERQTATIRQELIRTCNDPTIETKLAALRERIAANVEGTKAARVKLETTRTNQAIVSKNIAAKLEDPARAELLQEQVDRLETAIKTLATEQAQLRREESALIEAMFKA